MANIKINDLSVKYINKSSNDYVFRNLNLEIEEGSFVVLVGYSGEGKTTLLKCISGFLDYEGAISINGIDALDIPISERGIAYMAQDYVLFPNMTIFDNIAFPLRNIGTPKEEVIKRVNEVSDILGISSCLSRKPRHISGGQQQKTSLARALIKKPSIILFDEPLSNLDYPTRVEARRLIRQVCKAVNATVIYVTHNLSEAISMADKVVVLHNQSFEMIGSPLEIIHTDNPVVKALFGDKND